MDAFQVLNSLRAGGIDLFLVGDSIRASPREALTDQAREQIRNHKAGLVTLLRSKKAFRAFHHEYGQALAVVGWALAGDQSGLLALLTAGGKLETITPWRIVFRAGDGSRVALLRSGQWISEPELSELEEEELLTLAGKLMADGFPMVEVDRVAALILAPTTLEN